MKTFRFIPKTLLFFSSLFFFSTLDVKQAAAQYQGTPPLFEFRSGGTSSYKKLYFFSSDRQRLDISTYYFSLKSGEFKAPIDTLVLELPDHFFRRLANSEIRLCAVKPGGVFAHSNNCVKSIGLESAVDKNLNRITIKSSDLLNEKLDYALISRFPNPPTSGMYQLNLLGGQADSLNYLGSWLVIID